MNVIGIILMVAGIFLYIFASSRSPDKMWTFAFSWVLKPEAYYFFIVVSLGLVGFGAYLIIDQLLDKKKTKEAVSKFETKQCPKCAETIKFEAKLCKHCSYEFSEDEILRQNEERDKIIQYDEYALNKIDDYQLLQIAYDYQYNQHDFEKAKYYLERLRNEFPQSQYLPYVEQRLREMGLKEGEEGPSPNIGIAIADRVPMAWTSKMQGWQFSDIKIAAPAYPFLLGSGVLIVLGLVFSWWLLLILGLGAGAFLAYCFRDPERPIPSEPEVVVSPADGTVLFVDTVWEDRFLNASARRVAISLSLLDVHVNRAPVAGVVVKTEHQPGQFTAPVGSKADRINERRIWMLADEDDRRFLVVQIAGQLTRRIVPFAQGGQRLDRGERLGMICFGSRVDLFFPLEAQVTVAPGARILAGTDVVARLPMAK